MLTVHMLLPKMCPLIAGNYFQSGHEGAKNWPIAVYTHTDTTDEKHCGSRHIYLQGLQLDVQKPVLQKHMQGWVCSVVDVWCGGCHMACRHAACQANDLTRQHTAEHGSTSVDTLASKHCQVSVSPRETHSCKGKVHMQLPAKTINISGHHL